MWGGGSSRSVGSVVAGVGGGGSSRSVGSVVAGVWVG